MRNACTLALLEQAPDRQTAELLLLEAVHQGAGADQVRASWARWKYNHARARGRA